ncbi:MAG: cupin domain-containing protein [Proteobacteria bacterium]|nr:cupin domain-containing protein [Pseudomonadota bacterium]
MKIVRASEGRFIPASHEDPRKPGVLKRVIATRDELFVGRPQMINWALLPVGQSFRPHYHEDMEEVFIVVRGQAQMRVGAETVVIDQGDAVIVSPGEVHEMSNLGAVEVEYLVVGIAGTKNGRTVLA